MGTNLRSVGMGVTMLSLFLLLQIFIDSLRLGCRCAPKPGFDRLINSSGGSGNSSFVL